MKPWFALGVLLPLLTLAVPVDAVPVEGNVGLLYKPLNPEIYGIEAEVGPTDAPWSVGFLYQARRFQRSTGMPAAGHLWVNPQTTSLWGRYEFTLANTDSIGVLAGVNWNLDTASIDEPIPDPGRYIGPLVGASYTVRSGILWARVTPHYVFSPAHRFRENLWFLKSGIPWLEAGIQPFPGLQISFRVAETFLKLAWTFD